MDNNTMVAVTPEDYALAETVVHASNIVSHDGYYEVDIDRAAQAIARHQSERTGAGEAECLLTAYVSEDTRVIGIEHDTDADWQKVHDAHVALRDRLNVRIAERNKCPHKPATLSQSTAGEDGT